MVSLEGALSAVRNARSITRPIKEWKRWIRHYAAKGRPLGAMLLQHAFTNLVEEGMVLLMSTSGPVAKSELLDVLILRKPLVDRSAKGATYEMLESVTELIAEEINLLEANADYLQVSSAWQQRLALEVKAALFWIRRLQTRTC